MIHANPDRDFFVSDLYLVAGGLVTIGLILLGLLWYTGRRPR